MAVNKTAFVVGALGGASVAVAAMAGAGMKLPTLTAPHGGSLINASTAPIFAPPPGAPESFADIFERVSPAVVSIHVTSKMDVQSLRRAIPGFENFPFNVQPRGRGGQGGQGQGGQGGQGDDGDQDGAPGAG
ncbi:MAG TPA: serine protease, partial [Caulobacteraceae bacterium]|nr:serine protease [Caulobacteraceae bacterium]